MSGLTCLLTPQTETSVCIWWTLQKRSWPVENCHSEASLWSQALFNEDVSLCFWSHSWRGWQHLFLQSHLSELRDDVSLGWFQIFSYIYFFCSPPRLQTHLVILSPPSCERIMQPDNLVTIPSTTSVTHTPTCSFLYTPFPAYWRSERRVDISVSE